MENLMGYKFQPSNEQILYLLVEKRLKPHFSHHSIKDIVDICSLEPWELATESKTESDDQVWYYFCEPYYKYRKSNRAHRRTKAGYWKITSKHSQIEARNGLKGTKKILTFYGHGAASKEAITEWVMHEYHVKDDPGYKKEFVFSRIERKWKKKKHGTSTTGEGESSKQLVFPPQPSPTDHLISYRNHSEEQTLTNSQQQLQNKKFSYPGNLTQQYTIINPQSINPLQPPNSNLELQLPLDHPSVTHNFAENNFQEECSPIGEFKSYGGYNLLNDASFSTVQAAIYQEQELKYSSSSFDNCDFSDCLIDSDEQVNYLINSLRAFQHENSGEETGQTLTPDFNPLKSDGEALTYAEDSSDTNTVDNNAWVKQLPDNYERLLTGEFESYGGYNKLNDASFPAVQTPIYQEQELKYSNSSSDNCDFSDHQISSDEQINFMINSPRAFQDENSREETGQTLTPNFNPSKSDGEGLAYAEDSSDTNTAYIEAWIKEQLENFA